MRMLLPSLTALFALVAVSVVDAQSPPGTDTMPASPTVKLTAEQHHIIKEIVLKDMKVEPAPADARVGIGDAVESNVALHAFPPTVTAKVPEVRAHNFFVKNDQVVIVSVKDRTVADVIK
jgi:Protein of unknown function (DUF1236)